MAFRHPSIPLTQSDTLPPINLTVLDSEHPQPGVDLDKNDPDTWARINLSTVERVVLLFKLKDEFSDPMEIPCEIINPAKGTIRVEWREGDLDVAGDYEAKIRIYYHDAVSENEGVTPRLLQWTSTVELKFDVRPLF